MNLNEFTHKINHNFCPMCGCIGLLAIMFALFILVQTCSGIPEIFVNLGISVFLAHIFMTILWISGIWALHTANKMQKLDDSWKLEKENEKIL